MNDGPMIAYHTRQLAFHAGCSEELARELLKNVRGDAALARDWLLTHAPTTRSLELVMARVPNCSIDEAYDALYHCNGSTVDATRYLTGAAAAAAAATGAPTRRGAKRGRSPDSPED